MNKAWKKYILLGSLYLAAFAAIIWFMFLPNLRGILQNKDKMSKKESELQTIAAKTQALKETKANSREIDSAYDIASRLWPDKEEVSGFIVEVEALAAEKGLILNNLSVNEKQSPQTIKNSSEDDAQPNSSVSSTKSSKKANNKDNQAISFSLDTAGSYAVVKEFVSDLEKLSRLNTVNTLSFSSGTNNNISLRINGYIYAK